MRIAAGVDIAAELPLWPPVLATAGPGGRSQGHAHHAMHVMIAREGMLAVRAPLSARARRAAGVVTAPDVPHAIDATGAEVLLVFIDPESAAGASLRATLDEPVRLVSAAERDAIARWPSSRELLGRAGAAWLADVVAALGGERIPRRRTIHPRVRKALALLRAADAGAADASLDRLAREVGLSPGRLMHAFTESIGIPLRPYVAWLRLQRAAAAIARGGSLTSAAAAAGFADSAHMSRAFRAAFGLTPSALRHALTQPVRSSGAAAAEPR
jgi:AraC-like DNA-binding protein